MRVDCSCGEVIECVQAKLSVCPKCKNKYVGSKLLKTSGGGCSGCKKAKSLYNAYKNRK